MRIPARFNGPPGSGNGGFSAGIFAAAAGARVGGPAIQVTLRLPPPLDTPLTSTDGAVRGPDGSLVAEVAAVAEAGDSAGQQAVRPVSYGEAVDAARGYLGFTRHPFPTCYVCGPQRAPGDGLRIFPGPLADGRTAAPWAVPADVHLPTMWAALDCPGGWSVIGSGRTYVLGRIIASVDALPAPGNDCVVVGEAVATEGRKAHVRSAVYGPTGRCLATATATWIEIG